MGELSTTGTDPAVEAVRAFLGGPHTEGDGWGFDVGEHLESNWGAVYGGALAAAVLAVARAAAPGTSPRSLHLQIVRSVPQTSARATATVRRRGRTVSTLQVELFDVRGKLAVVALATMVTPEPIATQFHDTSATVFEERRVPVDPDHALFASRAPVNKALEMSRYENGTIYNTLVDNARPSVDGTPSIISVVTVPWDDLAATGPEAACLVADSSVGLPIINTFIPTQNMGPNPDLSLRFTTAPATRVVKAASSMVSVQHGTATVVLEVQAGDHQLAHGVATSLLLDR